MMSGRREGRCKGGRCPTKNLKVLLEISCLRETVMFERQRQYSLLLGRLEPDQHKVCELKDRALFPSHLPDVTHVTVSPRPFCILQAIKNWRQERARNKVSQW